MSHSSSEETSSGLEEDDGDQVKEHRPLLSYRSVNRLISSSSHSSSQCQPDVIGVFVVAFDTRAGNVVEWCIPEDMDLEGIEFKAMASGSHKISSDFIYFKKGNLFGVSCFENMPVESEVERRARMKSVGLLASSYSNLHRHMDFLECQVSIVLQKPGRYEKLCQFYEQNKGILPISSPTLSRLNGSFTSHISLHIPNLKITHPAGCFSQFLKFFGEQVFILWKFVLLKKRILFFSPPPIGVVCYRVYCASCLGSHDVPQFGVISSQPLFYINIADTDMLETLTPYIACTTERIFEMKTHLYDVFVNNQNVSSPVPLLQELLTTSRADREKYNEINRRLKLMNPYNLNEKSGEECSLIAKFFTELNNMLFHTLLNVAYSGDRQVTNMHMVNMGLDPVGDRRFLMELVEMYGIDVVLTLDNTCCPT